MTAGVGPAPAPAPKGVLVSVFCRDHTALADFYATTFGFPEVDVVRSPIFTALDAGHFVLGFHHDEAYDLLGVSDRRSETGSRLHITFDVGTFDDVDASVERLVAAGATVIQGPFTTYYDARQVVLSDPEGNLLRISSSQDGVSDLR